MKYQFKVDAIFEKGILRLQKLLGFELGNGICVSAQQGKKIGVSLSEKKAVIFYKEKHHFFRELGLLIQHAKSRDSFEIMEDDFFTTLGYMHAAAPLAPNVSSFKEYLDFLALMGYNMAMLYTEDKTRLTNYPYFGYMKGCYTVEELKELDDYAFDYGIEMIPCIECYGHMGEYLIWSEARKVKDTSTVLLAREDATFELIEELIATVSGAVRSKRIHIGMDEAGDMGRGKFMDKHGYVPPIQIFEEYMERLVSITAKYGLTPMMWSDMYFKMNSKIKYYYDTEVEFDDDMVGKIPDVQMVFWHYGEEPKCDDAMLKKHKALGKDVLFAGGLWDWYNLFPDTRYCFETMEFSMQACRNNGVREMMVTSWNGGDYLAGLLGLSFSAEKCYQPNATEKERKERFEFCTRGNYDAFLTLGEFNNIFHDGRVYEDFNERFLGNALMWQDVLKGTFDTYLFKQPMSGHYEACAEKLKGYQDCWSGYYRYAAQVFEFLALKTKVAENLWPAYQKKDHETLAKMSQLLACMAEKSEELYQSMRRVYNYCCSELDWGNYDMKMGALTFQIKNAKDILDAYLEGKKERIEGLECERLHRGVHPFMAYLSVASVATRIL